MIKSAEVVNVRTFKSNTKEFYLIDILVFDNNNKFCVHSQFVDKDKYNNYVELLDVAIEKGEKLLVDLTSYDVSIYKDNLVVNFDI